MPLVQAVKTVLGISVGPLTGACIFLGVGDWETSRHFELSEAAEPEIESDRDSQIAYARQLGSRSASAQAHHSDLMSWCAVL